MMYCYENSVRFLYVFRKSGKLSRLSCFYVTNFAGYVVIVLTRLNKSEPECVDMIC